MIDIYLALALTLLILGIVGSIVPSLPGPLFSLIGVSLYWWSTGYTVPGNFLFTVIVLTGLLAFFLDYIASYVGASKAGASKRTALYASLAAGVLFFVLGPLGIVLGVAGVVFLRELMLGKDPDNALNSALVTTVALLASTVSKVALTGLMLTLFTISILL